MKETTARPTGLTDLMAEGDDAQSPQARMRRLVQQQFTQMQPQELDALMQSLETLMPGVPPEAAARGRVAAGGQPGPGGPPNAP